MYKTRCPICKKEYTERRKSCTCGFEGLIYPPQNPNYFIEEYDTDELFEIYKFTKRVVYGKIDYPKSELYLIDDENITRVDEVLENRGVAYVDLVGAEPKKTVADEGLLALRSEVKALILNTDEASTAFLDESYVKVLFFGADFKAFTNGYFIPFPAIKYIWVDAQNKYFSADNNVLFDKTQKSLIYYAKLRPETEYTVPATVKRIGKFAFYYPSNLKKLFLPRGVQIDSQSFLFDTGKTPDIVYY
jgi:hypothetical protein